VRFSKVKVFFVNWQNIGGFWEKERAASINPGAPPA
jgi:hypothetical protein